MRVLLPNHFPLQGSGSGIYTLNVAQELVKAGHKVFVVVPEHHVIEGHPFEVRTIIFSDGHNANPQLDFNFPCFTTHPRSTTTFYELTAAQIRAYSQAWQQAMDQAIAEFHPHIVHANHVWVASYAAHKTGLPYVISCHGTDLMGFKRGPRYRELAHAAAHNAYGIIAISRQVRADAIETYGLPNENVHLIWNGFDAQCFRVLPGLTREAVLAGFGLTAADKPLISFVGKFTRFKGIDVLLKAAAIYEKELPGVQTLLAGHGELWEQMHTLQEELKLRGIHFLGHQPQHKVARLYNVADVSVVPSRVEPFGLVAVEALACGTPVVATNEGGLPDFINESVGALVPVDDPAGLALAIIAEVENGTKQTKGVYASQYALDRFTWSQQVAEMIKLYQGALGKVRQ
jgi:glycosyltransferase involved in cell wall biosynthesis